jgi:hypothetical protein
VQQVAASLQQIAQHLTASDSTVPPSAARAATGGVRGGISSRTKPKNLNYNTYQHFAAFWAAFPLNKGKYPALKVWIALGAEDDAALAARITTAAMLYSKEREGQDPSKTKHASGWLNDHRWEDESSPDPADLAEQRAREAIEETERFLREHGPIHG